MYFFPWIYQDDATCRLAFITHHALAGAFTTTMLISELMDRYHAPSESRRPLDRLRRWAGRHPQASLKRTNSRDPRVVQALEKRIRGDMSAREARRRIAPIQPPATPGPRPADDAPARPAPHVVEALELLVEGEVSPREAKRLLGEATP